MECSCHEKALALDEIARKVAQCTKCPLFKYRRNPVPGEGNACARIVFVGEAPGRQEDLEGRPFVGAAGKLLTSLLQSIGLSRSEVFITNILKCRPPGNRDPRPEEVKACTPYLDAQLDVIRPKVIVCLGRHSARYLLGKVGVHASSIMRIRGKPYRVKLWDSEVIVLPTLHPAAALYNPRLRGLLEEDFALLGKLVRGERAKGLDEFF